MKPLVYTHNVVHCHSCKEEMPLRGESWLYYAGFVFHNSGSCRALYERMREKGVRNGN